MCPEDAAHDAPVVVHGVSAAFGLRQLLADSQQVIVGERVKQPVGPRQFAPPRTRCEALADLLVLVHRGAAQPLLLGAVAHEGIQRRAKRTSSIGRVRGVFRGERLRLRQGIAFRQVPMRRPPLLCPRGTEHLLGVLARRKAIAHDPNGGRSRLALVCRRQGDADLCVLMSLHRDLFS